jgi:drug/metabolite transporter (DMT)-like permease
VVTPTGTWPTRGRGWLAVGQAACLASIVLAGRASAQRPGTSGQGTWLAVAIAAALVSAAGNGVWLATMRRAAAARRRLVLDRLAPPAVAPASPGPPVPAVMVAGLTLRHRPDCPMVAGRPVVPATAGTRPCGWCSP